MPKRGKEVTKENVRAYATTLCRRGYGSHTRDALSIPRFSSKYRGGCWQSSSSSRRSNVTGLTRGCPAPWVFCKGRDWSTITSSACNFS